jgi:hypothetical protein
MRYQAMLATMAPGVAMSFGHAAADGPDSGYGAREVGTVRFIDRPLNLIQLDDGTELRTTDARMLQNIKEGMQVLVDWNAKRDQQHRACRSRFAASGRQSDDGRLICPYVRPVRGRPSRFRAGIWRGFLNSALT